MTLPPAFEARLQARLGDAYADFLASLQQPASVSLRLNPRKLSSELDLTPVPWTEHGYYLPERPLFTLDPWLHAGAYYVQEASSMLLEQALVQHLPTEVPVAALDLCGAPGGKSTHLSSLLPEGSLLVSNEVIRGRSHILSENLQKWGSPALVTQSDPSAFAKLPEMFDVMVVDAPCSGEGLFRKDAAAIDEWSEGALQLCEERQRRILAEAWPALKPGGLLVYSTCTFHPGENERNLAWLARQHAIESLPLALDPTWGFEAVASNGLLGYYALPHRVRGEGFFLAVLRKGGGLGDERLRSPKRLPWTPLAKQNRASLAEWVEADAEALWLMNGDTCALLPGGFTGELAALWEGLRIVQPGLALAEVKKKDLRPAHALALSPQLRSGVFPTVDLPLDDAIAYLRKAELSTPLDVQGWCLLAYQGLPLGWGKALPRRMNNYYPPHWKIRMNHDAGQKGAFLLGERIR
jgi:16S rRNA C967 or C1407 C5-methylase (RsmB/RsmF family)/NOL1/NOP2/fmu family ribosome biogenesis protein